MTSCTQRDQGGDSFKAPLPVRQRSNSNPSPEASITSDQVNMLTNLLLKMDQRLETMETRLKDMESSQFRLDYMTMPAFPQFSRLPTEIRLRIWDLAIPRRKLRYYYNDGYQKAKNGTLLLPNCLKPPALASVNREARSAARRRGDMYQMERFTPSITNWDARMYWTWFDASHDVLELATPYIINEERFNRGCIGLVRVAECILVKMTDIREGSWLDWLFHDTKAAHVRRSIYIQQTWPVPVCKRLWHPRVVADLFGDDLVVMVDMEDQDDVRKTCQTLGRWRVNGRPSPATRFLWDWNRRGEKAAARGETMRTSNMEEAAEVVRKAWILRNEVVPPIFQIRQRGIREASQFLPYPADPAEEARLAAGMPDIKFVFTMEVSDYDQLIDRL